MKLLVGQIIIWLLGMQRAYISSGWPCRKINLHLHEVPTYSLQHFYSILLESKSPKL